MVREETLHNIKLFKFIGFNLWPNWKMSLMHRRRRCVCGCRVEYISVRSSWFMVSFKCSLSLLIFCLVVLPITVSGVLKSSLGKCKPSVDSRAPKALHQTDSISVTVQEGHRCQCFLLYHLSRILQPIAVPFGICSLFRSSLWRGVN